MAVAALFLAAGSQLLAPLLRDTNSAASVHRGIAHFEKKEHEQALKFFNQASSLRPGSIAAFDIGTAQVAAGNFVDGAQQLTKAAEDPRLRMESLYNRGNSALSANALDYAIRDYVSALKLRPGDRDAKRNLEIALLRRQSQQRQQPQQQSQQQPDQPDQQQQQQPRAGGNQGEQKEQTDADSLLRSVEQQEREELSRMRKARAEPRRIEW